MQVQVREGGQPDRTPVGSPGSGHYTAGSRLAAPQGFRILKYRMAGQMQAVAYKSVLRRLQSDQARAGSVVFGTVGTVSVVLDLAWVAVFGGGVGLLPLFVVLAGGAGLFWGLRFGAVAGTMAAVYVVARAFFDPELGQWLTLAAACVAAGVAAGLAGRASGRTVRPGGGSAGRDAAAGEAVRLLGDASDILTSSLDVEDTVGRLLDRLIPDWADWATVDVATPRGEIKRLASAHSGPSGSGALRKLADYPPELLSDAPISRVLRSGRPVIVGEVGPDLLERVATSERHRALLNSLDPRSALVLPLVSRKRMVGALALVRSTPGRRYDEKDLTVGMQLADRVALAIDNSQLFHEAADAAQAKADFLAVMSHELRTPLSAILGFVDLLEAEIAGPVTAQQRDQIVRIRASSWHLADLVDEVLTYARIEAGQHDLRMEEVDIAITVTTAIRLTRPTVDGRSIEMRFTPPADPIRITTDPSRTRQILVNLLSNATKFTEQGSIEVKLARDDVTGTARITVADTGVGIAKANLDRVFEPFWQADQGPTRSVGGMGLGLAVAQRLARIMGGDITVESTLGRGSRFHLRLPLRPAPELD